MTLPIIEQIARKLVARLEQVKSANGCHTTLAGVQRPSRFGKFPVRDREAVVVQGDAERNEEHEAQGSVCWDQPFFIQVIVLPDPRDMTPIDMQLNLVAADIEKAIATGDEWHNWDGLAIETRIEGHAAFDSEDDSITGVSVAITITYRTAEHDPYTVR